MQNFGEIFFITTHHQRSRVRTKSYRTNRPPQPTDRTAKCVHDARCSQEEAEECDEQPTKEPEVERQKVQIIDIVGSHLSAAAKSSEEGSNYRRLAANIKQGNV